jgi:hypothetical protein
MPIDCLSHATVQDESVRADRFVLTSARSVTLANSRAEPNWTRVQAVPSDAKGRVCVRKRQQQQQQQSGERSEMLRKDVDEKEDVARRIWFLKFEGTFTRVDLPTREGRKDKGQRQTSCGEGGAQE